MHQATYDARCEGVQKSFINIYSILLQTCTHQNKYPRLYLDNSAELIINCITAYRKLTQMWDIFQKFCERPKNFSTI